MKKILLLIISFWFIVAANAQTSRRTNVQNAHDRYANKDTLYLYKAQNKTSGNTGNPATRAADSTNKKLSSALKTKHN